MNSGIMHYFDSLSLVSIFFFTKNQRFIRLKYVLSYYLQDKKIFYSSWEKRFQLRTCGIIPIGRFPDAILPHSNQWTGTVQQEVFSYIKNRGTIWRPGIGLCQV